MKIAQLNHAALDVSDLERSTVFYRDVLNLEPIPRPDFTFPGAWFRIGANQELHLIASSSSKLVVPFTGGHIAFGVTDIGVAEAVLEENQVAFTGPKNRPDGVPQIFLHDPDGHIIELTQIDAPA